jgi:hypothetical protein
MRQLFTRGLPAALVLLLSVPSASRAVVLITRGDTLKELGKVNPERLSALTNPALRDALKPMAARLAVAFEYHYWGIWWVDFWTWGGKFVVHDTSTATVYDISAEEAGALLDGSGTASKPFWYTFPPGLLIIAGIIALCIIGGLFSMAKERKVKELFDNDAYVQALNIMSEHAEQRSAEVARREDEMRQARERGEPVPWENAVLPPDDGGWSKAVDHLEREGIPRPEAEKNLSAMLQIIAQQQAAAAKAHQQVS